jgi:membrane-associated protein
MTPLVTEFLALVEAHGEWMLFVLAFAETCFITGLVVPSGVATSLATILALEGHLSPVLVAASAVGGGWLGDTTGYWIGRWGGDWLGSGEGRMAGLFRKRRDQADRIFGRHPLVSVTLARTISFVRTVMPMAAGMSSLSYRRYLPYQVLGVTAWASLYMALGLVAGESWEMASRILGVGGAAVFAVAAWVLWRFLRPPPGAGRSGEGAESAEVEC